MQTMPSNGTSSVPSASSPTTAQVFQGQLQDYELLLSFLRAEVNSLSHFSQTLIRPRTFSPLDQENETGQSALQSLLKDPDYQALCQNNKVSPHYLIVTLKDGAFVYETSNRDDVNKTALTLTGNARWKALRTRIEKSVPLLAGQIRYDRLVSLPRMATFYGMAPWDPTQTAEHQAAIDTLEEKIATFRLGLEEDFNILDLKRSITQEDRHVSFQSALPAASLHGQFITGAIKQTIQTFLPDGSTSLLTHLAGDILLSATPERVRAQPTVYLQKILQSSEAEKLADLLLSTMDWYGGKPGEETSPHIRTKVVANALQIWFKARILDYPDRIAGYDLQTSSNWGKSYKNIWRAFENHLLTSKRASSEQEAIVMARLFLCQFPAEFQVTDIPIDLSYRGTVVWVNFVNGVNLVKSTDPKALSRRTFQQLVNLPLQLSKAATKEQSSDVGLARLLPTMDWAVTQGVIPQKRFEEYTQGDIERALSELDKHTSALNKAILQLNAEPPKRLSIAQTLVENHLHVFNMGAGDQNDSFWKEHDLARISPGAHLNPEQNVIKHYSAIDVMAENKFDDKQPWSIFKKNGLLTEYSLWLDQNRILQIGGSLLMARSYTFPDCKALFEQKFKSYMNLLKPAYETLIRSLLASLPFSDRQALELGTLTLYTLRKETYRIEARHETPEKVLPLRARNGLLLKTTYRGLTTTFELLPRAGVIRRIDNLDPDLFGGVLKSENWPIGTNSNSVKVLRHQNLPFDWKAHSTGSTPLNQARCEAIIEQLGQTFMAPTHSVENDDSVPLTINSNRCREISNFIATHLLFKDPKALRTFAYGQTKFNREEAEWARTKEIIKIFVPFWKSIEDITSDDMERKVNGAFGLSMDWASFAFPIGKFVSGSAKLISNASRLTVRVRLTAFSLITKELLISTLQAMNPIDGVGTLLKALGSRGLKLGRSSIFRIRKMAGKAGHYEWVKSLPQISDASRWRPLASGDGLATFRGIDDVPIRNMTSAGKADYRLIDPVSARPYGPSLPPATGELSLGRSHYSPLETNNRHVMVEVSESTRIREMPEVDGRTTLFLDDVPYRLDGDILRRVDLIDDSEALKLIPCRPRRAPEQNICINSYVTGNPAPTPETGSFDETKGYAPWFGDRLSTPAGRPGQQGEFLTLDGAIYRVTENVPIRFNGNPRTLGFAQNHLAPSNSITATLEFRKGIYARIEVRGAYEGANDLHRVGAILVPALDDTATHVFTRINTHQYYLATVPKGHSLREPLTFKRMTEPAMADGTLGEELLRVYTGSLNANNIVRIHGIKAVERAMKTMEEIAIPIGTMAIPPRDMKWLKVDTSPGEALMFDNSTRMIVTRLPEGASSWTRSKEAPPAFRQKTAEIFDTLFLSPTINPKDTNAGLRIDNTMQKLQRLLPRHERPFNARNIAYAEVTPVSGHREIYVSVSGAQGSTTRLPLFRHLGANHVRIGDTTYINIDFNQAFPKTSLAVTAEGKILAVPLTIKDVGTYKPIQTVRPTSLDSESKLISVIREKYPDPAEIRSIEVATTMRPCESCSVVMKQFGHEGAENALKVLWN